MNGSSATWPEWRSAIARRLNEILKSLTSQATPEDEFFLVRISSEVDEVTEKIEHFCRSGELFLRDAHSRSEILLDAAFSGADGDIFRGVHFAVDSRFMFSTAVRTWADRVDALLSQGRLREVRRLVVFTETSELANPTTARFIANDGALPGHRQRYLFQADLRACLATSPLRVPHDFGIYGTRFVFTSASSDPSDLSGFWTRRPDVVRQFVDLFDACWDRGSESPP